MKNSHVFFITGKGGSGKSTASSLLALKISKQYKVLLISLDAAHSLSDIFFHEKNHEFLTEKPIKINDNLRIWEPDFQNIIEKHVQSAKNCLNNKFRYLTAFSLEKIINLLADSPGAMEESIWETVFPLLKTKNQIIIFDAPPTGLALKLLAFPFSVLNWVNTLSSIKREIEEKKSIVSNISGEMKKVDISTDIIRETNQKWILLTDMVKNMQIISVTLDKQLYMNEWDRFNRDLKRLGLETSFSILNKYSDSKDLFSTIPLLEVEPVGMKLLNKLLNISKLPEIFI